MVLPFHVGKGLDAMISSLSAPKLERNKERSDSSFPPRKDAKCGSRKMAEHFQFADLRELLVCANEEKSGDQLAGIAARTERERGAAKRALADITLEHIVANPVIAHADVPNLVTA